MIQICAHNDCTGCSACMNACSKSAILMIEEEPFGYIHPSINKDLCIDCGMCENVCPVNHPISAKFPVKAFAAICKDEKELTTSASGGASAAFSNYILNRKGVVFGCVQRDYVHIKHERIDSADNAYLLKGSKYVQSNINYTFKGARKDLIDGKKVLFLGTPCQVGALRSFLHKDYDNLYTVDLCCHGVPSQKLLREDVKKVLKYSDFPKDNDDVLVSFREKILDTAKHKGYFDVVWGTHLSYGFFVEGKEGKRIDVRDKMDKFLVNNYITAFMAGITFRENCFHCQYAKPERCSDITIADYWGIGKCSIPTEKGISLILINTEKGQELFDASKKYLNYEERSVLEGINGNGQLQHPFLRPSEKDIFENLYTVDKEEAYKKSLLNYKNSYKNRYRNLYLKNKIKSMFGDRISMVLRQLIRK